MRNQYLTKFSEKLNREKSISHYLNSLYLKQYFHKDFVWEIGSGSRVHICSILRGASNNFSLELSVGLTTRL